jgi:hypothetical protein
MSINWYQCEWVGLPCNGCTGAISLWKLKKKLSGRASNLLAHEDLRHLRKPIIGIYKPSSIMKIPTSIWKWQNMRLSIMKNMVLLWSTSVEKDSNIVPSLFFSHFFFFFLFFFFFFCGLLWPLLFDMGFFGLFYFIWAS